jgi:hypothetical protein
LDYFDKISAAVQGPPSLQTRENIEAAKLCFFLVCVNQIATDFNPSPEGFEIWASNDLNELSIDPEVCDIIDSFANDIPAALLRANRLFAGANVPQPADDGGRRG